MNPQICILLDRPRMSAAAEGRLLTGFDANLIEQKALRAGIPASNFAIESISQTANSPTEQDFAWCIDRLNAKDYNTIVALDEIALGFTTGKKSIWKWHLSPLDALPGFRCRKVVPTFHPDQLKKEWHLGLYFELALTRAARNIEYATWRRKAVNYILGPSADEAIAILEGIRHEPTHSIDIETGRNQINTFGIAWSGENAVALKMLPDELPPAAHYRLWELIREICEGDSEKIAQNGIYERMYLSRYGIHVNNFTWDTMCAMKFLWPELEKGLDNVGRVYTMEPYWKDDGRVASEEGKQKDWGDIRDWAKHLDYNCKDSSNTLIASVAQRQDMQARGLLDLYTGYIQKLFDPVYEMGTTGFPLSAEKQAALIAEYEAKSDELQKHLSEEINPRSSKQKLNMFRAKGYKIPKKRASKKESCDELSLKQMRLQHPNDTDIKTLLEIAKIEKALSSYLRVRTLSDKQIRFQLDPCSTETWRMSCSKDPWNGGFNAQTMTDYVKKMIEWPEEDDRIFIEFDLEQAETRYVAYEACEENLLGMLSRNEDVHRFVAAEIYNKPMAEIVHGERQLGKKSGHGASYGVGVTTFLESCLKEMDLVLTRNEGSRVMETYHRLFPGVRRRQADIRRTIYNERKLVNPFGMVRYFWGRMDDNTYREAYAHNPQSTIPQIANHLLLGLAGKRTENAFDFKWHIQTHDSVTLSCRTKFLHSICEYGLKPAYWHPKLVLPAGPLVIPTSAKWGRNLGEMTKYKH